MTSAVARQTFVDVVASQLIAAWLISAAATLDRAAGAITSHLSRIGRKRARRAQCAARVDRTVAEAHAVTIMGASRTDTLIVGADLAAAALISQPGITPSGATIGDRITIRKACTAGRIVRITLGRLHTIAADTQLFAWTNVAASTAVVWVCLSINAPLTANGVTELSAFIACDAALTLGAKRSSSRITRTDCTSWSASIGCIGRDTDTAASLKTTGAFG